MPPSSSAPSSTALSSDLRRLATNYAWTWQLELRSVLVDALGEQWNGHGHPFAACAALTEADLERLAGDSTLVQRAAAAAAEVAEMERRCDAADTEVAYISAEFGVSETLPQYSGGLGILAGDHLKAASDLGYGLVAVGLFYTHGYFTQSLGAHGQSVSYDTFEPADLGLADTGIEIAVETPRGDLAARVWLARIGAIKLYMLDARVATNPPWAVAVTDRLYGGDQHRRIDQEMLLGIGGLRALVALGIAPAMVHLNEGHAGFCLLEMLADRLTAGDTFDQARAAVRERTLFTTHTPVPAGIDRFPRSLLEPYLALWCTATGVAPDTVWALGDLPSNNAPEEFNMAAFCLGHAAITNGVSMLHGDVSRSLFASRPEGASITSVTNGVHARTWTDPLTQAFLDRHLGDGWDQGLHAVWSNAADIADDEIVELRRRLRTRLVDHVNREHGTSLDPDALTVGFARRFATYKRAALLLRKPDELAALLADDDQPLQFIFAGKAHPADFPGQAILRTIADYSATPAANGRFVFVPGYDMALAALLYGGCDVWLNTPVRPQEACGTSGEKSALNGGLNCSILDGWWAEWHHADNGWAIPTSETTHTDKRDDAESESVHDLLVSELLPAFYGGTDGPSDEWVARIRFGWQHLGPKVTASRMVAEYRDRLYRPLLAKNSSS